MQRSLGNTWKELVLNDKTNINKTEVPSCKRVPNGKATQSRVCDIRDFASQE